MHLAQHAPGFPGLGNAGLRSRDAMQLNSSDAPLESVTRTISARESALDALILAWALLLQRQRGDDNRVEHFTWGHRSLGGTETPLRFSLSALGLELNRTKKDPVSTCLASIKSATTNIARPGVLYLFFNDELDAPLSSQKDASPNWFFQLGVTRQAETLTLQGIWPSSNTTKADALTAKQANDRLDTFIELLTTIVESPTTSLSSLLDPLPRDLDQIWAWNAELPPLIDRTMQDIISEQADANPDKLALSSWDGAWTYAELELMSTRLAHHLCSLGITVGTNVPLCFEKCRWTIVALLAIMKAGGAFALTDPTSQPEGRLRVMVEQTGGKVVMASASQTELAQRILPEGGQVVTVSEELFQSFSKIRQEDLAPLPAIPTVTSPLYIQFTSGSTGKPKGVVVSHANFTSGAIPRAKAVGYRSSTRCFEFASYAFDVSIDCMLCTLAVGGTICIPSDADRMNDLGGAIVASGANMAHMTPSVARVLDPAVIADLDVLGLGGEAVSAADAAAWSKGKTSVIIAYGPSECTVGCTVNNTFARNKDERKQFTTGNIGKGVGAVGWIVDPEDHDRLVPVGSVGELLVEGPVVGLGYLGEAEKTAEVFIDDPAFLVAGHGATPGRSGKMYKTGDLVRYDADGSGDIVFVGRKDAQVKLRGQRVELVEIEHHLRRHLPSGIKIAAEVIKPLGAEPTLVAFLTESDTKSAASVDAEGTEEEKEDEVIFSDELLAALSGIEEKLSVDLPRYMVPATYIPLRAMPVLPSAKIDRKKLRALGAAMTREQISDSSRRKNQQSTEGAAPSTEMEVLLAGVWRSLLGDQVTISVQDSFFALGGDSLRAMRLVPAARAAGISVTVADVFRYPVLRDMAVVAKKASSETGDSANEIPPFGLIAKGWSAPEAKAETSRLCNVDEADVEDVYPCTPLQEALMALSAKVKEAYVAQRVLKMDDAESAERLKSAFETVAADSPILRTRIVQVSQYGLMQVLVKEPITWRSASSLAQYLELDRDEEMALGTKLVRFAMIRERGAFHFVLTMHHALYDGWSMPLVVDRVNQAYQGVTPRQPAAQFKHFIDYLDNRLDRAGCDAYWREQLDGATGVQFPRLPFEGYQTQADSLLEVDIKLDGRKLPTLPGVTVTLATVVRAAWALVASQYCSGNSDIVFGETLTGRNAPIVGVEEIEGPMITTVPVRVTIDREATVEQYLQAIAEHIVGQIPYEHAGLQHIRKLSDDALQACELRTGFVLHPAAGEVAADDKTPANGLVPAGDNEAAQEALKFNTYALMLVCSLSADGFFVMASFDSKTVDKETMARVLEQLRSVVHQLCEVDAREAKVGAVQCLTDADKKELEALSRRPKLTGADLEHLGIAETEIEAAWIADAGNYKRPSPRGAVGELLVETKKELVAPAVAIERPAWLAHGSGGARLYRTGRLASFDFDDARPALKVLSRSAKIKPDFTVPKKKSASSSGPAVTATSSKQKLLRGIWSRLLRIDEDKIFLGDSFFSRGGDSITAMKLASEARQLGMQLSVAQVFGNRTLYDMANVMQPLPTVAAQTETERSVARQSRKNLYQPFSLLLRSFMGRIQDSLANRKWQILDVLPARPLQEIAVRGTVELPRFSIRYELMHFEGMVDKKQLFRACQELVASNEVLRTVFVRLDGTCYSVVIDNPFTVEIAEYEIDDDVGAFAGQLSRLDAQTRMPYGSSFVKWFFVTNGSECSLVFRLSHAQYDEICLPIFINQLHQLYQDPDSVSPSYPFSAFVNHVVQDAIPAAVPYWRNLLEGAKGISVLRPDTPVTDRRHYAIHRTVDISARSRDVTVATLPSAAWALTLARLLGVSDVVFGEVASGRGGDVPGVPDANLIAGPCWQYVPTRVRFDGPSPIRTGRDLLESLQTQHMTTSQHDCMGLEEILRDCCGEDWDHQKEELGGAASGSGLGSGPWFDTVVHQDVAHVEELDFWDKRARFETVYAYEEPLREWKIQAFYEARPEGGERLTIEIVTFRSWKEEAGELLDKVCEGLRQLVERPEEELGTWW